jgi:hypothetical protein
MTILHFDDRVLALCDDLWSSGERLVAFPAVSSLAAFTGFETERVREMLMDLGSLRDNRDVAERLYLDSRLAPLITYLQDALD